MDHNSSENIKTTTQIGILIRILTGGIMNNMITENKTVQAPASMIRERKTVKLSINSVFASVRGIGIYFYYILYTTLKLYHTFCINGTMIRKLFH